MVDERVLDGGERSRVQVRCASDGSIKDDCEILEVDLAGRELCAERNDEVVGGRISDGGLDQFDKLSMVEQAFKTLFGESVQIMTKTVRAGGTSNNIYVPKKYKNNPVTLVIWPELKMEDVV